MIVTAAAQLRDVAGATGCRTPRTSAVGAHEILADVVHGFARRRSVGVDREAIERVEEVRAVRAREWAHAFQHGARTARTVYVLRWCVERRESDARRISQRAECAPDAAARGRDSRAGVLKPVGEVLD